MNLTRRDEFIKASPAIQVQSKMTLLQRRAWNVLLANAYDDLPNTDILSRQRCRVRGETRFQQQERELLERNIRGTCGL